MDGVLFDSEPLHAKAWQKSLADIDINYSFKFFTDQAGATDEELAEYINNRHPHDDGIAYYLKNKQTLFHQFANEQLQPFDGVIENLEILKQKFLIGLATSAWRSDMEILLLNINLMNYFSVNSTYDDVEDHKPHPAPYLLAAKILGVAPEECIAIDDSPSGLASATAAGMFTLGIASSFENDKLKPSEKVFNDTASCCKWIIDNVRKEEK